MFPNPRRYLSFGKPIRELASSLPSGRLLIEIMRRPFCWIGGQAKKSRTGGLKALPEGQGRSIIDPLSCGAVGIPGRELVAPEDCVNDRLSPVDDGKGDPELSHKGLTAGFH